MAVQLVVLFLLLRLEFLPGQIKKESDVWAPRARLLQLVAQFVRCRGLELDAQTMLRRRPRTCRANCKFNLGSSFPERGNSEFCMHKKTGLVELCRTHCAIQSCFVDSAENDA